MLVVILEVSTYLLSGGMSPPQNRKTTMTAQQVHAQLQNDKAYQYSREHKDVANMMIVLRAHGFNCTIDHAITMINL